jgi:hypothetical protein
MSENGSQRIKLIRTPLDNQSMVAVDDRSSAAGINTAPA